MSGKNQSAVKRRQAKKVTRQRNLKAQAHKESTSAFAAKRQQESMREQRLRYDIATKGVLATAQALKEEGINGKAAKKLNNIGVLRGVHQMIPVFATLHGAVEVASILVGEGRFVLTPEQIDLINSFDRNIVLITEDINAMYDLIDAGKKPKDYIELYVHYIDLLAEVCQVQMHELMNELFRPHQELIDTYIKEHASTVHTMESFSMELHAKRMDRVAPLYSTAAAELHDMTKPLGGELVDDSDFDAADRFEEAKPITDPLTC